MMGGIVGRLFREFAVTLPLPFHRFARRFFDDDSDIVREASAAGARSTRPFVSRQRTRVPLGSRSATNDRFLGASSPASRTAGHDRHHRIHHYLCVVIPRILPATGHRPPDGIDTEIQSTVSGDESKNDGIRERRSSGIRRGQSDRFHRARRRSQYREMFMR